MFHLEQWVASMRKWSKEMQLMECWQYLIEQLNAQLQVSKGMPESAKGHKFNVGGVWAGAEIRALNEFFYCTVQNLWKANAND